TGQCLDLQVAVADRGDVRRLQPVDAQVGIDVGARPVVGDVVEPEHAAVAVRATGAADHDVVATLGVVVVRTSTTDEDVVATVVVVLELLTVVAHQEVRVRTTLEPVVALVAERVVPPGATEEDVVPGAQEAGGRAGVVG